MGIGLYGFTVHLAQFSGGATALHFAAEHGHQVVVRLLLKDGVMKDAVMAAGNETMKTMQHFDQNLRIWC